MSRLGTPSSMEPDSSLTWRFPVRRVPFNEAGQLLRETMAPFRAFPLRLMGLFLLLFVVLVLVTAQSFGRYFVDVVSAVVFTGYTAALDGALRPEGPDFRHLGIVLKFSSDKLLLLLLSGALPMLVAVLVLYGVWGTQETGQFLDELSRSDGQPSPTLTLYFQVLEYVADMPFTFVAPIWAVYRWSGSRSMAANLLACVVNWRWVLAMTAFAALSDNLLAWLRDQGNDLEALSYVGEIATTMLTLSWTLALSQRCLPSR